ncbi:MAG TPA: hypothetical protein DDX71_04940 [Ruminococcus sp.]|nr:hypothetical protein [Ruminococcus sp.]
MKTLRNALVFCAAAAACILLGNSLPIYADTETGEAESGSEILAPVPYSLPEDMILTPLFDAINAQREAAGSGDLTADSTLMDMAAQRVTEFARNPAERSVAMTGLGLNSETVILGYADPNTALSAVVLNEKQHRNLVYDGYHNIGMAVNEENTIWVILLSS